MKLDLIGSRLDLWALLAALEQFLHVVQGEVADSDRFGLSRLLESDDRLPPLADLASEEAWSVYEVEVNRREAQLLEGLSDTVGG
jgi:hypothetical protein